jgi:ABC-type sugar transport system permease subunit
MALMAIWSGLGLNVLIMLSAMKNINPSLYEACEIDGLAQFGNISCHTSWCRPDHLSFYSITSTIGSLQAFDQMYLMTGGGPDVPPPLSC